VIAVKLAGAGLADALIPYAVEEFETGTNAYSIAGAARVVRAASVLPVNIGDLIAGAIDRIRSLDQFVDFDGCQGLPAMGRKTAVEEALEALHSTGAHHVGADAGCCTDVPQSASASCCGGGRQTAAAHEVPSPEGSIAALHGVELQNQDGTRAAFGDIFSGRPGLIAFFYTRCMNPEKCSRTISQLGEVQRIIRRAAPDNPAMLAGISYDPQYDLPERLHRYGSDRGLEFDERCQLLRSTGSFDPIRDALDLGVGYGSATVNRHRIELFLIDRAGAIVHSRLRRLWQAQEVADLLLAV
jgi:cytochrome oxidase Cu insertion factor (SCO1/SenC/PrrC family)